MTRGAAPRLALAALLLAPPALGAGVDCRAESRRLATEAARLEVESARLAAEAKAVRGAYDRLSDERDATADWSPAVARRFAEAAAGLDRRDRTHAAAVRAFEREGDAYDAAARAYEGRCMGERSPSRQ